MRKGLRSDAPVPGSQTSTSSPSRTICDPLLVLVRMSACSSVTLYRKDERAGGWAGVCSRLVFTLAFPQTNDEKGQGESAMFFEFRVCAFGLLDFAGHQLQTSRSGGLEEEKKRSLNVQESRAFTLESSWPRGDQVGEMCSCARHAQSHSNLPSPSDRQTYVQPVLLTSRMGDWRLASFLMLG